MDYKKVIKLLEKFDFDDDSNINIKIKYVCEHCGKELVIPLYYTKYKSVIFIGTH